MVDVLKSVLYLNIIVLDGTQAVKNSVREKIDKTLMPPPMKMAAKKIGAKAASKMATPSVIAQKLSQEMPRKMPEEMSEKGLTVSVEPVFVEGPYLVMQLQVTKINSVMMAELKALERQETHWTWLVRFLTWLLEKVGAHNQRSLEEEYLPQIVQRKMEPLMNDMLKLRLEEEMQMEADTMVLGDDKQARYFYQKLKEVRESSKKGR